mmetsp:Transcript_19474/g.45354  ORF Transcript_19474/g.45354 Transcript_19474/m.45354 type:complete len:231 (+) Transcript_19474:962-1654(+)
MDDNGSQRKRHLRQILPVFRRRQRGAHPGGRPQRRLVREVGDLRHPLRSHRPGSRFDPGSEQQSVREPVQEPSPHDRRPERRPIRKPRTHRAPEPPSERQPDGRLRRRRRRPFDRRGLHGLLLLPKLLGVGDERRGLHGLDGGGQQRSPAAVHRVLGQGVLGSRPFLQMDPDRYRRKRLQQLRCVLPRQPERRGDRIARRFRVQGDQGHRSGGVRRRTERAQGDQRKRLR